MEFRQNDQLRLAAEFVQFTDRNIFLTGKAGTGKTTFLHNLRKITPKRMVVVAPTGVAAINAGGVTIHSFFQLSFAPSVPEAFRGAAMNRQQEGFQQKFNRDKINLIKCIDLLVIDEVSMVRADVLDSVDEVLRRYRNHGKPFGGVQLLMIGDLHQLSPVIKDSEWNILRDFYPSVYFFDSLALKKSDPVTIELKEIFRQSDAHFISILNNVRENVMSDQTIRELNTRFIQGFKPRDEEGYITLTTHNANASEINMARLSEIQKKSHLFTAEIKDSFPAFNFPTEEKLELKVNAQVMFIKNDLSGEKRFYNGKIGKITRFEEDQVYVKCPSDDEEIAVNRVIWENVKYSLNETTKEIKEEIAGTFTQYPLKLAWAITIHKSQGLTFEKVVIDANAAFAFGQVYVALSRCRTFNGIVLSTPIAGSGIKTDTLVVNYAREAEQKAPGESQLLESKHHFQQALFFELFDLKLLRYRFDTLMKTVRENSRILVGSVVADLAAKRGVCDAELFQVAEKFKSQLTHLMASSLLPEENPELQERTRQGAVYFSGKLKVHLTDYLAKFNLDTDNKAVWKSLNELLEKLRKEAAIRHACLETCIHGFETISYIRKRSGADVDYRSSPKQQSASYGQFSKSHLHPALYMELKQWRDDLADEFNLPTYMILPQKSLLELMKRLPTTLTELKTVKGIGQAKIKQYGQEMLTMIREYCDDNKISPVQAEVQVAPKKEKTDSGKVSFEMFMAGKTIAGIAAERQLAASTIESHLAPYVGCGQLNINQFVPDEKLKIILKVIEEHPNTGMGEIKTIMGDAVTYADLRFAQQFLKTLEK